MESKGKLLNSVNLIHCPKCRHENSGDQVDAAGMVSCSSCGHSFPMTEDPNSSKHKKRTKRSLDVIPVRCNVCQKKFGVKFRSAGKEVACPHCKAQQVAPSGTSQPIGTTADDTSNKSGAPVDSESSATDVSTEFNTPPVSPEVLELLPPKYLVPQTLELTETIPVASVKTAKSKRKSGFEIDTDTLRLPVGNTIAEVQQVSRERRERRKQIRVATVYLVGVIVLIVVFWWLMGRIDLETPELLPG